MYSAINFKTKKAFKEAVESGQMIRIYQPGRMFNPAEAAENYSGTAYVEGPHYPAAHTWYATVEMKDGYVVKVK
jgi:hypothetical protein